LPKGTRKLFALLRVFRTLLVTDEAADERDALSDSQVVKESVENHFSHEEFVTAKGKKKLNGG